MSIAEPCDVCHLQRCVCLPAMPRTITPGEAFIVTVERDPVPPEFPRVRVRLRERLENSGRTELEGSSVGFFRWRGPGGVPQAYVVDRDGKNMTCFPASNVEGIDVIEEQR